MENIEPKVNTEVPSTSTPNNNVNEDVEKKRAELIKLSEDEEIEQSEKLSEKLRKKQSTKST